MKLTKIAAPLLTTAVLAACGGGGGDTAPDGGSTSGLVNALKADSAGLYAFAGDVKSLRVFATDIQGADIATPALSWSSSSESVATAAASAAASTGTITTKAAGSTSVIVTSNGKTLSTPLTVLASPPTSVDALKGVFPYVKKTADGVVSTYSDVDAAGNDARFAHFTALWTYMSAGTGLLPNTGAPSAVEFYFTRDTNILNNGRALCGVAAFTSPPQAGSLMSCSDGQLPVPPVTTTERWFYVAPSNPLSQDKAQMQHELAEAFFERAVPNEKTFAWLYKGSTLYHESGVLTGTSFAVTVASLKARLIADPTNNVVPTSAASTIIAAPYDTTTLQAIHSYSYGPAAVILFLEQTYPGKLRALIDQLASGAVTTNDAAVAALLALTGVANTAALDASYLAWRTANGL
jgi:hypothetical protein